MQGNIFHTVQSVSGLYSCPIPSLAGSTTMQPLSTLNPENQISQLQKICKYSKTPILEPWQGQICLMTHSFLSCNQSFKPRDEILFGNCPWKEPLHLPISASQQNPSESFTPNLEGHSFHPGSIQNGAKLDGLILGITHCQWLVPTFL